MKQCYLEGGSYAGCDSASVVSVFFPAPARCLREGNAKKNTFRCLRGHPCLYCFVFYQPALTPVRRYFGKATGLQNAAGPTRDGVERAAATSAKLVLASVTCASEITSLFFTSILLLFLLPFLTYFLITHTHSLSILTTITRPVRTNAEALRRKRPLPTLLIPSPFPSSLPVLVFSFHLLF